MKVTQWYTEQKVNGTIEEVWNFFSHPANLDQLTPPEVNFSIKSISRVGPMYPGMLVQYRIRPIRWLPINFFWVAEIKQVQLFTRFIDEQRYGPFAFWYHEHAFEVVEDGVLIKDILHYRVPLGFLGKLIDILVIRLAIKRIFKTRKEILCEYFQN
jgi:ligand-binding SRPBCC domain-containing protein